MQYTYRTTNKSNFLTPFKRTDFKVISQTPECIHSVVEFENGLIFESKVYSDHIENATNMEFVTNDGITYELRK